MPEFDDAEHGQLLQAVQDMVRCPDKLYDHEDNDMWLVNHLIKLGIAKGIRDAVTTYIHLDSLAKANDWLIANPERV